METKEKSKKSKKARFSLKYQIMALTLCAVILTITALSFVALPKITKALTVATESHMMDFVESQSKAVNTHISELEAKMDEIAELFLKTNESYTALIKASGSIEQIDLDSKEASVWSTFNDVMTNRVNKVVTEDGDDQSHITVVSASGVVLVSTKNNGEGIYSTIQPEVLERFKANDGQLHAVTTYDEESKTMEVAYYKSIENDGQFAGAIIYRTTGVELVKTLQDYSLTEIPAPKIFILDQDALVIAHIEDEKVGSTTKNPVIMDVLEQVKAGTYNDTKAHTGHYDHAEGRVSTSYVYLPGVNWVLGINALDSLIYSNVHEISQAYTLIAVFVVIAIAIVIVFLAMAFTKPMEQISDVITQIADLNFQFDKSDSRYTKLIKKNDEIGDMARSVMTMIGAVKGNLDEIKASSQQVNEASAQLKSITTDISEKASDTSAITEELSASMEETTASTSVITNDVASIQNNLSMMKGEISKNTDVTLEIMKRAETLKKRAYQAEENTRATFAEIKKKGQIAMEQSKATAQINELAKVIMDIADQTSLLALNASIEAARAGESGKGFAVVADEIGNLAQQSANTVGKITDIVENVNQAVKNITECLSDSQNFVEENVYADYAAQVEMLETYNKDADNIYHNMNEIDGSAKKLYETVQNMAEAINAINDTIQEASIGVSDIAERNNDIGDLTAQSYEMVNETNQIVEKLDSNVSVFKL